ncbi:MAG: TIGR00341 family protein [Pseudoflavonifractor sp.]|nr:TIGR00341 family protein [Alloprevotella sp.]MCM1116193.1 TIGR00341 family protein [Pseudoflavonifractor sp.]
MSTSTPNIPEPQTPTPHQPFTQRLSAFMLNYFSFSGQLISQAEAEASIREGVSFRGANIVILILAILIASLGLNTNSTAVIIGAMLISPLMGPIIGCGLGVGIHDFDLIKRSMRNLVMAAGFSVIASTLYFIISPVNEQHSELLARTTPTIYDVFIGFVGGGAGILAIASRNKGNVIPGVAIATALMPPLCTAGYGLATWQLNYFFGAFYLFLINSVYIAFATFIGVKLMKYRPDSAFDSARSRRVMKWVYSIAILVMMPAIYLTITMLRNNKLTVEANRFVAEECRFPATQVIASRLYTDSGQKYLRLTLIGKTLPADSLVMALEPRLAYYGLSGAKIEILQGDVAATASPGETSTSVRDIYQAAQTTISRQQEEIDSLKEVIREGRSQERLALEISPEIRVLFPEVKDIAISRSIFAATREADGHIPTDTATMALVVMSKPLSKSQFAKFHQYLCARLAIPSVEIVTVAQP